MKRISKGELSNLIERLKGDGYEVYGPRKVQPGGDFHFEPIESLEQMDLDGYVNTLYPPKSLVFLQEERVFWLSEERLEWIKEEKKRAIVGIRPCDIEGLSMMDNFFLQGFVDPWYKLRRDKTFIMAFSCFNPLDTCFCKEAKAGPWAERGYDIQIHDLGEYFLAEAGSERGESLLDGSGEASKEDIALMEEMRERVLGKFKERPYMENKLHTFSFEKDSSLWRKLGDLCFHCGGCTYICPTCSCFNVFDLSFPDQIVRSREWDSCLLSGYHRMAGDNPKEDISDRMHFHMECKLSSQVNEKYGRIACTGCGRCLVTCIGDAQIESLFLQREER